MKCAIVGCGYVADMYAATRHAHPELEWVGAWDNNADRLATCSRRWGVRAYRDLAELCDDPSVALVLNLTNPRSHVAITKQCLLAGKHVYSEKPLAMTVPESEMLAGLARDRELLLSSAPCSLLSPPAQTLWHGIRNNVIGTIRLAYANFDDGMIAPWQAPWLWKNAAGVPWPAKDEFEVGCTYEHAGYVLTWLSFLFGAARRVSGFASCVVPDKGIPVDRMAPDFTIGGVEYANGVTARVTCGLVAPRDKSITIVGDDGVMVVANVRDEQCPVMFSRRDDRLSITDRMLAPLTTWAIRRMAPNHAADRRWREYPRVGPASEALVADDKPVDFLRGPAEMAAALAAGRTCRLSPELGVHIVDLTERLQHPERFSSSTVTTTCPRIEPL
jgi:predicted dehydrogenase